MAIKQIAYVLNKIDCLMRPVSNPASALLRSAAEIMTTPYYEFGFGTLVLRHGPRTAADGHHYKF